jgi:hypothetical protein
MLRAQHALPVARATLVLVALLTAVAGCGGDDENSGSPKRADTTTSQESDVKSPEDLVEDVAGEARPTRRDREVQRNLKRYLRQEELGGAGGWRFADVKDVQARSTHVAIDTRLPLRRREVAASLCQAARRFFLEGGQGQTAYDVVVGGRGGIFARC